MSMNIILFDFFITHVINERWVWNCWLQVWWLNFLMKSFQFHLHIFYDRNCTQKILFTTTMIFRNALLKFVPPPFVHLFDSSNLFVNRGTPSLALDRGNGTPKKSNDHHSPSKAAIEEESSPVLGLVRWTDSNGNRRMRSTRVRKPPSRYGIF